MGMILTTTNPSLLSVEHLKVISDSYGMAEKEYTQVFKTGDANQRKSVTIPHTGALSTWNTSTEGASFNSDEIIEGSTAEFNLVIYTNSYDITHESVRYDQYDVINAKPQKLVRGLLDAEESAAATVLNNGFATDTIYDGVYLFSNSHPLTSASATTYGDNLTTGAISYANIKAAVLLLRNTVNESNIRIRARANKLWCAGNIEFDAMEIMSSQNIAGEISNTKNKLPSMTVAGMTELTDGYWGVMDESYRNLVMMWFEEPTFDRERIPGTRNWKVWGYAAFQPGVEDWRGIVGSTGS